MTKRTTAQRAAERRYDAKRRNQAQVVLRLKDYQERWLQDKQRPDESRAAAIRRLADMPE